MPHFLFETSTSNANGEVWEVWQRICRKWNARNSQTFLFSFFFCCRCSIRYSLRAAIINEPNIRSMRKWKPEEKNDYNKLPLTLDRRCILYSIRPSRIHSGYEKSIYMLPWYGPVAHARYQIRISVNQAKRQQWRWRAKLNIIEFCFCDSAG